MAVDLGQVPLIKRLRASTFTMVPGNPPRGVPPGWDLTTRFDDGGEPRHTRAIYRLDGNLLTYCVADPGLPRPTDFSAAAGDGRTLIVLQRFHPGSSGWTFRFP